MKILLAGLTLIAYSSLPAYSQTTTTAVDYAGHSIWKGNPSMAHQGDFIYILYTEDNNKGRICRYSISDGQSVWSDDLFETIAPHDISHNDSAIAVDGDGYLHCWIGMHNRQGMQYYRSDSPGDIKAFSQCSDEMPQPDLRRTYPWSCTSSNGDVFVIFREARASDNEYQDLFHWNNKTKKWKRTSLLGIRGDSAYMSAIYADKENNVHIATAWSDYHFHDNHFQRGSYLRYDVTEDKYYKADGTEVTKFPIDHHSKDADLFYENQKDWGEIEEIQTPRIAVNTRNQPVIVYPYTADDGGRWTYRLARWDGEKWTHTEAYNTGTRYGRPLITLAGSLINIYATDLSQKEIYGITSLDDGANVHLASPLVEADYVFAKAALNIDDTTDFFISKRHLYKVVYDKIPADAASLPPLEIPVLETQPGLKGNGDYTFVCKIGYKLPEQKEGGTGVIQNTNTGESNQIWTLTELDNGYYKIVNKESGLALYAGSEYSDPERRNEKEYQIEVAPYKEISAFHWKIEEVGYEYFHIINKKRKLHMVPAGHGGNTDVGTPLVVKKIREGYNEYQWQPTKQ